MRKIISTLLVFLALSASATTFYISPSGNDATGTGAVGNPWKTLFKATTTVTTSGDIIHVNAGTYLETSQCILAVGVSIEGDGVTSIIQSTFSSRFQGILRAVSSVGTNGNQHISNIKFDGRSLTNDNCLEIQGRSNFSVYNCFLQDFVYSGLIMNGNSSYAGAPSIYATGNSIHDNIINNCAGYIAGTLEGCVQIGGMVGFLMYNNTITQNQRASGSNGEPVKYYSDGYLYGCTFHHNKLTRALATGLDFNFNYEFFNIGGLEFYADTLVNGSIDLNFNIKNGYAYSAWIHDNYFYCPTPNTTYGQTCVQMEFNSEDIIIEDNHARNYSNFANFTPRTGDTVRRVYIRNNLVDSTVATAGRSGSFIGGFSDGSGDYHCDSLIIDHNTFTGVRGASPNFWSIDLGNAAVGYEMNHCYVTNNIISSFTLGVRNQSQGRFYNSKIWDNDFYDNDDNTPLPSWPSATTLDASTTVTGNITINPAYTGLYVPTNSTVLTGATDGTAIGYTGGGGNTPPVANAGADTVLIQPVSSLTIVGSGSDADGTIVSQAWTQLSGPATITFTNGTTYIPTLSALTVAGAYIVRLTVTDNLGATGTSDRTITVVSQNPVNGIRKVYSRRIIVGH